MADTNTVSVSNDTTQTITAPIEGTGADSLPASSAAVGTQEATATGSTHTPTGSRTVDIEAILAKQNEALLKRTAQLEEAKRKLKQYEVAAKKEASVSEQPTKTDAVTTAPTGQEESKPLLTREEVEALLNAQKAEMSKQIEQAAKKAAVEAAETARKQVLFETKKAELVKSSGVVLVDLVTGTTEEEISASIKVLQEKEAAIRRAEAEKTAEEYRKLLPKGVRLPGEASTNTEINLRTLARTNPEAYRAELARRGF
jgi:hypothetical protein